MSALPRPFSSMGIGLFAFALALQCWCISGLNAEEADFAAMDLQQLMELEVTTATKKPQALSRTAAAAFVITAEDIERSGATSIPEALRLAPGVEALQISPSKWSVSIRGFSGRFANKLLVLMDGRALYTPSFGGVYWEQQDLLMSDIERIEVIRGPGSAIWGANAMNGIINIITRHASETLGNRMTALAGDSESLLALERGAVAKSGAQWRAYAKSKHGRSFNGLGGTPLDNGYTQHLAGFRGDYQPNSKDSLTLQGQVLALSNEQSIDYPDINAPPTYFDQRSIHSEGSDAYLRFEWQHVSSSRAISTVQAYLSHYYQEPSGIKDDVDTFDVEFRQHLIIGKRHDIVWGTGYRHYSDELESTSPFFRLETARSDRGTVNTFIQDEIELFAEKWWLTIGGKLEYNETTGSEFQPTLRTLWTPTPQHSVWASISQAIRTPSRIDSSMILETTVPQLTNFPLPISLQIKGNEAIGPERLTAWELGYRGQITPYWSVDTAIFYHDYSDLRDGALVAQSLSGEYIRLETEVGNILEAEEKGLEIASQWLVNPSLQIQLIYTHQSLELGYQGPDGPWYDLSKANYVRPAAENILSLRSSISLKADLDLNLWLRLQGKPADRGENISALDINLRWSIDPNNRLSLMAKNLFAGGQLHYDDEGITTNTEVPTSVSLRWQVEF